jgi:hypothetical protein
MPFWNTTSTTLENEQMVVNNTYKDADGNNKLTTITTTNSTGYKEVVPGDTKKIGDNPPGLKGLSYAVQKDGKITYKYDDGMGTTKQFNSIQEFSNSSIVGYDANTTKRIKDSMQKNLVAQTNDYNTKNPTTKLGPAAADTDANKPAEGTATADQVQQLIDNAGTYKGRKKYPEENLKYPVNMNAKLQDCMKFQIIQYVPSKLGIGAQDTTLRTSASKNKNQNILTTITLPMPSGGITDRNSVDWGSSQLNPVEAAFADTAMAMIAGGGEAGANAAGKNLQAATANKDVTTALIAIKASEAALGGTGLLSRVAGLAVDSSLELLFNGPSLREFSFSFKMTPRSKNEAQMVRSIIRTFKQAMSVKRSESVLLLKSPHTFRISYLTSTKDHPYLNRFKECALTNCSVNYTPDGQYMSYNDSDPGGRSMTAYELSLSFSELEPIFDDDYETMEGAKGSFNHIGY